MPAVANRSVSAISRLHLQPGAVRVAIIATAPPPVITGGPALSLGGDHGARRGTDSRARNGAAAAPNQPPRIPPSPTIAPPSTSCAAACRTGSMLASPKNKNAPSVRIMSLLFSLPHSHGERRFDIHHLGRKLAVVSVYGLFPRNFLMTALHLSGAPLCDRGKA